MHRISLFLFSFLISATTALAQKKESAPRIAGWDITKKKDPFGEGDTFIAMRFSKDQTGAIAMRCLRGGPSFAVLPPGFSRQVEEGDKVEVMFKVDEYSPGSTSGVVVGTNLVQFMENSLAFQIEGSKKLFIRLKTPRGSISNLEFSLPNSRKIFELWKDTCFKKPES